MRAFISLDLPKEFVKEIKKIQGLIRKKTLFTGKLIEGENLHLTLKFLGEIGDEKVEEIKKRLREIKFKGFEVRLGDVGVFSKKFVRIIWVKLNGKGVFDLQKEIDEKLKDIFKVEERFMSHITIARVKHVDDKKELIEYLKSIKPENRKFDVKDFYLMKSELFSEGPVYEVIEEYGIKKYNLES